MAPSDADAPAASTKDEVAARARALLDAFEALPYHYADDPSLHAEGRRAILDSRPGVQVAVIREALDRVVRADVGEDDHWERHWRRLDILKALLRRRQPFAASDLERLLHILVDNLEQWLSQTPTLEILRAVAAQAGRDGLPPGQGDVLRRLRAGVMRTAYGTDRRKAVEILDVLLAGAPDDDAGTGLGPEVEAADADGRGEGAGSGDLGSAAARALVDRLIDEAHARPEVRLAPNGIAELPAAQALMEAEPPLVAALAGAAAARALDLRERIGLQRGRHSEVDAVRWLLGELTTRTGSLSAAEIRLLLRLPLEDRRVWHHLLDAWDVRRLLVSLLEQVQARRLLARVRAELEELRAVGAGHVGRYGVQEVLLLLDDLLSDGHPGPIEAVDAWGIAAREALDRLGEGEREAWVALLTYCRTATGARPSARWLKGARPLLTEVGEAVFRAGAAEWLGLLRVGAGGGTGDAAEGSVPPLTLTEGNATLLKGLVWMCLLAGPEARAPVLPEALAPVLAEAADRCLKKLPGAGPRAAGVGNGCIRALGSIEGTEGVLRLQWLRHRVTYLPALKLIDEMLEAAARRAGLDQEELQEMLAPTFGLVEGRRREEFGAYAADLVLTPRRGVELRWFRDGAPLKSEPAAARRDHGDRVKALKEAAEELRKALPTQRGRLERLLLAERTWRLAGWRERYLDHGLLCHPARRLIWWFGEGDRARAGIWSDGRIVGADDRPLDDVVDDTPVRLWHPIGLEPDAVLAWREWLERHEVVQPFKQAHREVYLLTDAELGTRTYSNRFAAHILRQHQMHALAQQRGWKAPLALVYDGAWQAAPSLALPRWDLRAELLVEGVLESELNDTGVYRYVSTDQVRFESLDGRRVLLSEVPALAFSEVMRDIDLFVGVGSVGNDPTWRDGGPAAHRTYWERYAFGELGESAKTRRGVLERLLPRLTRLAGRWTLADRFLAVRGDLRTYKIHLGSGNILMEPNDQYLCIVPERRAPSAPDGGDVFLPFEGDDRMAVILSKALLLADDRAITDPTITRQIGRQIEGQIGREAEPEAEPETETGERREQSGLARRLSTVWGWLDRR